MYIFTYRLLEKQETSVDKWFRQDFKHMMLSNLKSASTFVNSDPSDIVFSRNTTTGYSFLYLLVTKFNVLL